MMHTATQRLAYHVSGHAIVHIMSGVPFAAASITPSKGSGRLHFEDPPLATYLFHAQAAMAGSLAERVLQGKIAQDLKDGRFKLRGKDQEDFSKAIRGLMENEYELIHLRNWLFVRTANQLCTRWDVVQAIAEALMEKEHLTYGECKSIAMQTVAQGQDIKRIRF